MTLLGLVEGGRGAWVAARQPGTAAQKLNPVWAIIRANTEQTMAYFSHFQAILAFMSSFHIFIMFKMCVTFLMDIMVILFFMFIMSIMFLIIKKKIYKKKIKIKRQTLCTVIQSQIRPIEAVTTMQALLSLALRLCRLLQL